MNRFEQQLRDDAQRTNQALYACLKTSGRDPQEAVFQAMRYSLLDAGKRLRAALVLEFGRMSDADPEGAMSLACAVEMVHAYSLIHDDLPCMDNDDFRRGKPSCHKAFGEANALLAGDGLLTLAFETAASANLPESARLEAVRILSQAAGVAGMIGGQVIDLESEGRQISTELLDTLYALKTGALLRAAAALGCIAVNAPQAIHSAADAYATAYGLAFQITDDILDVVGDAEKLGKPVGSDGENRKTTYVTLFGIDGARQRAAEQIQRAMQSVEQLPDNGFLLWLAELVLTRDH